MAKTFKVLPSEILTRADTFDLRILDVGTKWHNMEHEEQTDAQKQREPEYSQKELLEILKKHKAKVKAK